MKNRIAEYLPASWLRSPMGRSAERSGASSLAQRVKSWSEPVEQFVAKHPGTSLAMAFAAGVAIAWWLKRR